MGHIKFGAKQPSSTNVGTKRPRETDNNEHEQQKSLQQQQPLDKKLKTVVKFKELPTIHPKLLSAILEEFKFEEMTPIQQQSIPLAIENLTMVDIIANAKTGSGKTLAFLIPCLHYLLTKKFRASDGLGALILAPTRELAIQIHQVVERIMKQLSTGENSKDCIQYACIMGGSSKQAEANQLKNGVNLIVATPGRLLDHLQTTKNFRTDKCAYWVLDEADMLIDVGFEQAIKRIGSLLPNKETRTTFLFSATLTQKVDDLVAISLRKNCTVRVGFSDEKNVSTLEQLYLEVRCDRKYATLVQLLRKNQDKKIIVFLSIKLAVEYVSYMLDGYGMTNIALHGNMSQEKRTSTFQEFMNMKDPGILVATDVAARGLDFPNVDLIIQVDIPEQIANYFHRVGRTARGGKSGVALLMLTETEAEVCLPTFNNYFAGLEEEENGEAPTPLPTSMDDVKKTLKPYEFSLDQKQLETDHAQLQQWVQTDGYMRSNAPKIANTLANVFRMYFRKYGFKHNQFDENAVKVGVGMKVGGGGGGGYGKGRR